MNHDEWLGRAEIYALGALDGEELTQFEAHLTSGCRPCERHLREMREIVTLLPRSLPPLVSPSSVKDKLLARIAREAAPQLPGRARPGWIGWGVGASGLGLVAASLLIALGWSRWVAREELRRRESQVASLRAEMARQEEIIRLLADPEVRPIALAALQPSIGATGRLLWRPTSRTGLLITAGLPPTPPGKAYELWAIAGKVPIPAGVFTVDRGGRALHRLPQLPKAERIGQFAVTLEPASGSRTPTSPILLAVALPESPS